MNDFILEKNMLSKKCDNFNFLGGVVTAVFTEGIIKAYKLAKEEGDKQREKCYLNFIKEASIHIKKLQIKKSSEKYAIGGFIGNRSSKTMKVDRNQHAIMMFMDAYNLGIYSD